jgi:hypothetical protein
MVEKREWYMWMRRIHQRNILGPLSLKGGAG